MSVPMGPRWRSLSHGASRAPNDGPILAAGWRVVVTSPVAGTKRVSLTDSDATTVLATVAAGIEVEILAWQPGARGTRYRVRSTQGGVEGWVGAASLKPRLRAPASVAAGPAASSARMRMPVSGSKNAPLLARKSLPSAQRAITLSDRAPKRAKRGSR